MEKLTQKRHVSGVAMEKNDTKMSKVAHKWRKIRKRIGGVLMEKMIKRWHVIG